MTTENEKEQPQKAYGLLAEYKNTTELVNAATKVRDAGYKSGTVTHRSRCTASTLPWESRQLRRLGSFS